LPVRLEKFSKTDAVWREIYQTTTASDGTFSIPVLLSQNASLRIASDGSWERLASQSAALSVLMDRRISTTALTSVRAGTSFSISGTVQPHQAGVSVNLQRFTNGVWKIFDRGALTDGTGGFTISTMEATPGLVRFRVKVNGDANLQAGQSPEFTVIVY
jgi:hypothetical protein